VLLPADPAFPPALLALERPPLRLHWQGRGGLWPLLRRRQAIAVVGTRRPSRHGIGMAEAIGAALAQAGWPVVSGLAEGIDGAVHQGCLARGGRPVAVLGTSLERVYPRHHRELQAEVAAHGLLVSELSPGTSVQPGHFAARNRLQVGLAQAVVVVECPLHSGALHSAALAMQQELPLWVVPADAGKASAAGSNRLLAQDATVLLDPADLIRQLGPGPLAPADPSAPLPARAPRAADTALLSALGHGASLEQLCLALEQSASVLAPRLLALELSGVVRAEPGLCWRPV
jgi:DNA processing protein